MIVARPSRCQGLITIFAKGKALATLGAAYLAGAEVNFDTNFYPP